MLIRRKNIPALFGLLLILAFAPQISTGTCGVRPTDIAISQDPITILLDNKLAKIKGVSVRSLFLVPMGRRNPVILVNSSQRTSGAAFVKWTLSNQDTEAINDLLQQGLTIRIIAADKFAVGEISSSQPKGLAVFNKKDLRGSQIKARESL